MPSRREHTRPWASQYSAAPCHCLKYPRVQSFLLLGLGFFLHSFFNTFWYYYVGAPTCNDPSTRELLWFIERQQQQQPNKHPTSQYDTRVSIRPSLMYSNFKQANGVLDRPAADLFGQGISSWLQKDLNKVYESFKHLGIDTTTNTITTSANKDSKQYHQIVPDNFTTYQDAIQTMSFRHDGRINNNNNNNRHSKWSSTASSSSSLSESESLLSTSTALDVMVQHTNHISTQLNDLNTLLTQLTRHQKVANDDNDDDNEEVRGSKRGSHRTTSSYSGSHITTPDSFTSVVNNLAIVLTWVNGSDPITQQRRKKRCYEHYGRSASHCSKSNWRLDRIRETGELLYALRAISQNMPWFKGLIYLVCPEENYPIFLQKNHPRLIVVPQQTIVPKEYQPTFNSETVKSFLHLIPNIPDIFLVFDDDMMVGRYAPPSVFLTQFGGPNLYFEDTTVRGCPAPPHQVWRAR